MFPTILQGDMAYLFPAASVCLARMPENARLQSSICKVHFAGFTLQDVFLAGFGSTE